MSDELGRLRDVVGTLARRERALLLWQTLARTMVLGASAVLLGTLAVRHAVPRSTAAAVLVLGVGIVGWFTILAPWLRGWRAAGQPIRQARLLEARDPGFRGRLVTVVGREGGPRGAESPALLQLAARRALERTTAHPPATVHEAEPVRRWATTALLAWVLAAVGVWAAPGGGTGVYQWWFGGSTAEAATASMGEATGAAARVGDLTLRYVYPDYTGLSPYEVVNSTGEAHGPPGTRVEVVARSAEPIDAAALQAYDQPSLDARVTGGRTISGSFVIQPRRGEYTIVTHAAGQTRTSPAYPIRVEPDLPPEVTVDVDRPVIEVPIDMPLGLTWQATDDYGIGRVELEIDGAAQTPALLRTRERVSKLSDVVGRRPIDLGLRPGETYELVVAAWDEDTVSGAKVGRSSPIELIVLGEDGAARLTPERRAELLDILVQLLGDHLEDPFPPGRSSGAFARWGETVNGRYGALAAFVDAHRGRRSTAADWKPVENALDDGRTLVRYTQVSFMPGATERANAGSVEAVTTFRDDAIVSVEDAVLHIDRLIRNEALRRVAEETDVLSAEAAGLRRLLERPDVALDQLAFEAEALAQMLDRVRQLGEDLGEGGLAQFLERRTDEADRLLESAREAMGRQARDEATDLMGRTAERLDELAEGIREELRRRNESANERQRRASDLVKKLEDIVERQDGLAAELGAMREQLGDDHRERVADLWEAVESAVDAVEAEIGGVLTALEDAQRSFNERIHVEAAHDQVDMVRDAAIARDLAGTFEETEALSAAWSNYSRRYQSLAALGHAEGAPGRAAIEEVWRDIQRLLDLLEQLRRVDAAGDPALQAQVAQLERAQQALRQELAEAAVDAERVAQEMPVTPRELGPALEDGQARMAQASDQLGDGEAMQAEGSQRAASQHVRDAIQAIKQAQQQAAAQGQELNPQGQGGKDPEDGEQPAGSDKGEGEEMSAPERFDLPEPEEFRTPEAYRNALLRGMEAEVPEEYRALKRRYYEELVHQ